MAQSVQHPIVGAAATYEGIWRPHWEIAHIVVRVPRSRRLRLLSFFVLILIAAIWLGILELFECCFLFGFIGLAATIPAQERWSARFPSNFDVSLVEEGGPIVFEGIVSLPGHHGHKGIMHRTVEIVRVLHYRQAEPGAAADRGNGAGLPG